MVKQLSFPSVLCPGGNEVATLECSITPSTQHYNSEINQFLLCFITQSSGFQNMVANPQTCTYAL